MDIGVIILSLVLGIAAALGCGALSGMRLGAEALGKELAAYMGGLYGFLAGVPAVIVGLIIALLF